jgi:hypothetical protein
LDDFDHTKSNASHLFWLSFYGIDEQTWSNTDYYSNTSETFNIMYWMFAKCMPWEYTGLFANIRVMKASIDFENAVKKGLDEETYWKIDWEYPHECYLDCQADRDSCDSMLDYERAPQNIPQNIFSQSDWAGLALPRIEIESSAQKQQFPPNISE